MIPILVIAYNRPDSLMRLFDSIRKQNHGKIYVHCDGPKKSSDHGSVLTRRLILRLYDEGFIEQYFFQNSNLGLMDSVHFASDWFFEINDFGLILEDDLIINPPALLEAEYLRNELEANSSVKVFCLANPLPHSQIKKIEGSYWFSNFFVSYAWATSRENWAASRRTISTSDAQKILDFMKKNFGFVIAYNFRKLLQSEIEKEKNSRKKCSFAWRFTFDQILNENYIAISKHNRIGYSGFGNESTNTNETEIWGSDFGKHVDLIQQQWTHPDHSIPQLGLDRYFLRDYRLFRAIKIALRLRTRIRGFIERNNMFRN
jgi:hypothetical protein